MGPSYGRSGARRETHGAPLSRSAISLQRSSPLGGRASRGRGSPMSTGPSARPTSADIPDDSGLSAPNSQIGLGSLARPGVSSGSTSCTFYDGCRAQPDGFSAAQSGQSQTTKEDS